jgi:hypothetical protein
MEIVMKLLKIGLLLVLAILLLSCSEDTQKGIAYTVTNGGYKVIDYTTENQTADGQPIYHFPMFDNTVDLISEIISAHENNQNYIQTIYLNRELPEKVIKVMPGVRCNIYVFGNKSKVNNYVEYIPYGDTQKIKLKLPLSNGIQPGKDTITLKAEGIIKKDDNIKIKFSYSTSTCIKTDYLWFLK